MMLAVRGTSPRFGKRWNPSLTNSSPLLFHAQRTCALRRYAERGNHKGIISLKTLFKLVQSNLTHHGNHHYLQHRQHGAHAR